MKHLYTRSPGIPRPPGSLHRSSLQDLFTRPLWEISIQELSTRSIHKTSMRDLFTTALYKISSQDLNERSLYNSSLQDLFARPQWEISSEELSARSLHKTSMRDLYTRALYKISSQDLYEISLLQDLRISLDLLGLLTGALYKISSQDLHVRSLYKISWYPWTSEIFSLQDLFKRPRSGSNTQKVPRGLRGRNQNRHRATARAIRHARTPQRVARAETKNAPGWAPATFHQQNEHGATARAIRHAQSPERVAFANIKSAPRHSETQKIRVPTAPWRQNYNTKCDFSMFCDASIAPATKKWVRGIRSPVTATRNDVNIADPNSTTVSQNEHFEHSKTDFKSTKYCTCHEKWRFFTTSNFEQPLRRFCTPLKTLTFCTLPDFRKSTRRAGENAPPKWTSSRTRLAQAKCKFSISTTTFHREGRQKSRTRQRTPPIYTRCFSTTVRTPKCGHTVWGKKLALQRAAVFGRHHARPSKLAMGRRCAALATELLDSSSQQGWKSANKASSGAGYRGVTENLGEKTTAKQKHPNNEITKLEVTSFIIIYLKSGWKRHQIWRKSKRRVNSVYITCFQHPVRVQSCS